MKVRRVSAVMKWAIVEGHRADNPAGDAVTAGLPRCGHVPTHQRCRCPAILSVQIERENVSLSGWRLEDAALGVHSQSNIIELVWPDLAGGSPNAYPYGLSIIEIILCMN